MKLIFLLFFFFFQSAEALDFKKLKTKSGIEFWFVQDNSIPIISLSFSFKGGSSLELQDQHGLANLMVSLMDEGTRNLNSQQERLGVDEHGKPVDKAVVVTSE